MVELWQPPADAKAAAVRVIRLLGPLHGPRDFVPEDPAQVRAQPLVVRLEKAHPPQRTAALEAAAAASLAILCDPRSGPEGEWYDAVTAWLDGRIRKVARRARGAQWLALDAFGGVLIEHAGAQVRGFPPVPVSETPKAIAKLQVGGTDLTDATRPGDIPDGVPIYWLAPDAPMTAGKAMAQVGHASMLYAAAQSADRLAEWIASGLPVAVREAGRSQWRRLTAMDSDAVLVRDAGYTEVAPGTVTVAVELA